MRTRVKICGLTREQDALAAVSAGADALGFVFCDASPRNLEASAAAGMAATLPPFVSVVGLFLNPERELVESVLREVPLDLLQFHGEEPAAFCESFGRRYIKAIPMGGRADPLAYAAEYPAAAGFLLDGNRAGERGGQGETFDWAAVPDVFPRPLVLAGGLDPGNVAEAVVRCRPYAVDVSSGVESGPGIKDARRIAAFMREVEDVRDIKDH